MSDLGDAALTVDLVQLAHMQWVRSMLCWSKLTIDVAVRVEYLNLLVNVLT